MRDDLVRHYLLHRPRAKSPTLNGTINSIAKRPENSIGDGMGKKGQ